MKIYLAGMYSWKNKIRAHAEQLEKLGFTITSTWLDERKDPKTQLDDVSDRFLREHAQIDWKDLRHADVVIIFTVQPDAPTVRGGRHVETGLALAWEKTVIICGPVKIFFIFCRKSNNLILLKK